jgi:spermidine synthase
MVHYTARFIDTIKRVLFVGGGHSMLLHEALKYPSLELCVGLELDQAVTRSSFKYFGAQPHWDNEKVVWRGHVEERPKVTRPRQFG